MNQLELTTAPVLDLTAHDLDAILDELRSVSRDLQSAVLPS